MCNMGTDIPLIYGASGKGPLMASLVVLAEWREAGLCKMHPLICFRPRAFLGRVCFEPIRRGVERTTSARRLESVSCAHIVASQDDLLSD